MSRTGPLIIRRRANERNSFLFRHESVVARVHTPKGLHNVIQRRAISIIQHASVMQIETCVWVDELLRDVRRSSALLSNAENSRSWTLTCTNVIHVGARRTRVSFLLWFNYTFHEILMGPRVTDRDVRVARFLPFRSMFPAILRER